MHNGSVSHPVTPLVTAASAQEVNATLMSHPVWRNVLSENTSCVQQLRNVKPAALLEKSPSVRSLSFHVGHVSCRLVLGAEL